MNKIYTFLVAAEESEKLEALLNIFRIGLNEWDRSKTFEVQGHRLINYTIVCEEERFVSITNLMNGIRAY